MLFYFHIFQKQRQKIIKTVMSRHVVYDQTNDLVHTVTWYLSYKKYSPAVIWFRIFAKNNATGVITPHLQNDNISGKALSIYTDTSQLL